MVTSRRCAITCIGIRRAKLLKPEERLGDYRWSSWPEYLKAPGKRWSWLRVDRLLSEYRIPQDCAAGRRAGDTEFGLVTITFLPLRVALSLHG